MEKSSIDLAQLFEPIRADLELVDREFARHVQSHVDLIPKIGQYIQTSGGKRIRPAVLLMAARLSGYQGERAVLYAAVVEFIHTATLVHDDIIDDSTLRADARPFTRGGATTPRCCSATIRHQVDGYGAYARHAGTRPRACDVTLNMIEGELYQLTKNGDAAITEDEHSTSSAARRRFLRRLFADWRHARRRLDRARAGVARYGFNLGITLQLVDDLLDFTGDTQAVGKPIGSDLREGKVTLALIHLLRQEQDGEAGRIVRDIIASRTVTAEQWTDLLRRLKEHASIDYAYRRAVEYAERAKKPLYAFPPSSERDALLALHYVTR